MSRTSRRVSISYFLIHALVEIVCFALLYNHFPIRVAWIFALLYDAFAFVPQGAIGLLLKKFRGVDFGTLGVILMSLGLCAYNTENPYFLATGILSLALGNACLHVCGAVATVLCGEGKLFPTALFVGGGSFGVITGQLVGRNHVSVWWLVGCLLIVEALVLCTNPAWNLSWAKDKSKPVPPCPKYGLTKPECSVGFVMLTAFAITAVRSFLGYAIPTGWRTEDWQAVLLFTMMGLGKAFGGYAADRFGAKITGIVTTALAIPFLVCGNRCMVISVIGIFLFSMTMSLTYGMLLSVFFDQPGLNFGVTTLGLFFGTLPIFVFGTIEFVPGIVLIIVLSLLCCAGFYKTLAKRR